MDFFDDEEMEDQFRGPTFEEAQRVSVGGRELNERDPHDRVLIAMIGAINDEFASDLDDTDRRSIVTQIVEQADEMDDLRLRNGRYLAAAYYFLRRFRQLRKKDVNAFVEQYCLNCPSFVRYTALLGVST